MLPASAIWPGASPTTRFTIMSAGRAGAAISPESRMTMNRSCSAAPTGGPHTGGCLGPLRSGARHAGPVGSLARQERRGGAPDAASGAGDDRDLIFQASWHQHLHGAVVRAVPAG